MLTQSRVVPCCPVVYKDSWTDAIAPFWPAVIASSLQPRVLFRLVFSLSWTTIKGAVTAFLMMQGFQTGTLDFGVFAVKKPGMLVVRQSGRTRTPTR